MNHIPVLLKEVIELLDPKPGNFIIDGTANGGGHSGAILSKIESSGKLLAVDWDKELALELKKKFKNNKNVIIANSNYANIKEIVNKGKLAKADGLLLDLGFSSYQMDEGKRGFSFEEESFLDMRYSKESDMPTAYEIINSTAEKDLADIIFKYGEERMSRRVAKAIVEGRKHKKIETAKELSGVIKKALPGSYERGRINPATRTFQALRIYVNRELENLQILLDSLNEVMAEGGRVAIISFHSLEDRIVKNHFKNLEKNGTAKILTKKPIAASDEEIKQNPKSRSAKLRGIQIITPMMRI